MKRLAIILAPLLLGGCVVGTIASTAVAVATLPVKAVSAGVDAVTTSQSEADEKRGREIRKAEEKAGRDARQWEDACRKARARDQACPSPPPGSTLPAAPTPR